MHARATRGRWHVLDTPPSSFDFTLPDGYTLTGLTGAVTLTVLNCAGTGTSTCAGSDPSPTLTQPSSGNGNEAVVYLDDIPDTGTHQFEVELTWTDSTATPEHPSAALLGAGLIALGLAGRKWKRR